MSDDVTTIFVGGIPDDMKEREFQNMFTFSTGFEAASLKFPSSDGALDKDGQKKQIVSAFITLYLVFNMFHVDTKPGEAALKGEL
ncbi:hypothetical protein GGH92_007280 [Coemansia sp. RSA 2673]|nr:hypothetical protein GGH92_007280 [Coemansia sp. RSA 2673]